MRVFGMCLNPKVVAGVAAVGVGVFLVAPTLVSAALPFLALMICPLSMLLMAGGMKGGAGAPGPAVAVDRPPATAGLEPGPGRDGELARLQARLHDLEREQGALTAQIGALTHAPARPGPAPRLVAPTVEEG